MKEQNEKWLDEIISRTINSGKLEFDPEKWKQKYPEEFQMLVSRAKHVSPHQLNIWRTIIKSKITKLTAAAVIIAGVGFFLVHRGPDEQVDTLKISEVTKSPAEMMTVMSLTLAYRKGGMNAVEKQCDQAFKTLGPRPASISVQELFAEFNDEELERTKL